MNKTKSLYKDPFTFFMLASTLFLAAASWLIIPPYLVLAGVLYVAAAALKWSIGAGVIAALWAGISVSMAYWWQGSLPVTVVISIVLYLAIAMIVGMGMQALRRHRQVLHDEKKYNQDALNSIGDPLFIIDRNYEISFANNRALEWLRGLDFNDEIIEKSLAEVMPCLPKSFFDEYRLVFETGEPIISKDSTVINGTVYHIETRKSPAVNLKGSVENVITVFKDLTGRKDAEKNTRSLVENTPDLIICFNRELKLIFCNEAVMHNLEAPKELLLGKNILELSDNNDQPLKAMHHASEVKKIASYMEQLKSEKAGLTFDTKLFRKNGEPFPASFSMEPLLNCEGEVAGTLTITVDKFHLQEREDQLSLSEQKFKSYIDHAPDGVFVTDEKGMFKEANTMAAMITGYTRNELLSKYLYELTPSLHRQLVGDHYKLANKRGRAYGEIPCLRKDAANRFWSLNTVKVSKNDFLVYCRDITERKQNEETIKYLSYYDNLTGLQNRLYLEEEMKRLEHKKIKPISLIMADLNGFKLVNESCGHDFGDKMLRDAAEILRCSCREEDIIARWSGDEFVILLPRTTQTEAQQLCSRIKDLINNVYIESIPLSVALGVGVKEEPEQDLLHILNQAEKEMYRHKLAESRS